VEEAGKDVEDEKTEGRRNEEGEQREMQSV